MLAHTSSWVTSTEKRAPGRDQFADCPRKGSCDQLVAPSVLPRRPSTTLAFPVTSRGSSLSQELPRAVYDRGDVAVGKILRAGPANGRSPSVPTIHLKSSVASGSGPLRNDRRLVLVDGCSEVGQERAETREVERSSPWPNDPVRENLLAVMLVTLQIFPVGECLSIDHSGLDGSVKEVFNL